MKQIVLLIVVTLMASCNYENNKTPDGTCDCNDLTNVDGIWLNVFDNPYTGDCITYQNNGNIESSSEFNEGLINGITKFHYESGKIKEELRYINGVNTGLVTYYYENGNKEIEGNSVDGVKEGVWKNYYENGTLESVENIVHGVEQDSFYGYYSNGNLQMKGFFINGNMEGKWIFFDSLSNEVDGYLFYENNIVVDHD